MKSSNTRAQVSAVCSHRLQPLGATPEQSTGAVPASVLMSILRTSTTSPTSTRVRISDELLPVSVPRPASWGHTPLEQDVRARGGATGIGDLRRTRGATGYGNPDQRGRGAADKTYFRRNTLQSGLLGRRWHVVRVYLARRAAGIRRTDSRRNTTGIRRKHATGSSPTIRAPLWCARMLLPSPRAYAPRTEVEMQPTNYPALHALLSPPHVDPSPLVTR